MRCLDASNGEMVCPTPSTPAGRIITDDLPFTGFDITVWAAVGLLLLVFGLLAIAAARRLR